MAFKMKGSPYPKLFGNVSKTKGPTEAEKLKIRQDQRRADGKPVGLKDNVKKFAGDLVGAVGGAVNEVGTGVAKGVQDFQSSVEGAGKTIKEGVKKVKAKSKAKNDNYKAKLAAHKAKIKAWKDGGKEGKRPKRVY